MWFCSAYNIEKQKHLERNYIYMEHGRKCWTKDKYWKTISILKEKWVPEWWDCLVEWEKLWVYSKDPEEATLKECFVGEEEKLRDCGSMEAVGRVFQGVCDWQCPVSLTGEGDGTPLQSSCLENPTDRGAWWAAVHGVAKSGTWLSDFTFTFHFHALEKEMATHSSVLAWRIPGTGEPGGLPSMGSYRVRHDWSDLAAASAALSLTLWELKQLWTLA